MDPCETAAFVTAIAVIISKKVPDNNQLGLLALTVTQLADTLATIAEQRTLIDEKEKADLERKNPV